MNSARQKIPGFEKQGRSMKVHLGRFPKTGERKVSIRIDRWDTYDMDQTLAMLIVPMLKQLKESKQGAPNTDSADLMERVKQVKMDRRGLRKHEERIQNGLRLFGAL
jgi:hypothetical protein